ncbi:hypothetical protein [Negadavirga shengliensis]|uniref:DUF4760 domain-containing protein n=1 Tax=Negadavirga shengliensis TaxID=1389218 RepID=A0ABV9T6S4_9BACT
MKNLRKKISSQLFRTETPMLVYVVVFASIFLLWRYRSYNEDVALNFIAELFGAAFTLFIIDVLLVRAKTKRWKIVRDEMNYLIARNVNRIRDGVSTRVFNFNSALDMAHSTEEYLAEIRKRRSAFLSDIVSLNQDEILGKINEKEFFSESSYAYFNEKADELWNILNMRYADYFHPELASHLIGLNVNLKDLCGHIRQYLKSNRFENQSDRYKNIGRQGAIVSLVKIITLLNTLKKEGYSESASMQLDDRR